MECDKEEYRIKNQLSAVTVSCHPNAYTHIEDIFIKLLSARRSVYSYCIRNLHFSKKVQTKYYEVFIKYEAFKRRVGFGAL